MWGLCVLWRGGDGGAGRQGVALEPWLTEGRLSLGAQVRAMQIIDELEAAKRGPYGGGVGHVSFSGERGWDWEASGCEVGCVVRVPVSGVGVC